MHEDLLWWTPSATLGECRQRTFLKSMGSKQNFRSIPTFTPLAFVKYIFCSCCWKLEPFCNAGTWKPCALLSDTLDKTSISNNRATTQVRLWISDLILFYSTCSSHEFTSARGWIPAILSFKKLIFKPISLIFCCRSMDTRCVNTLINGLSGTADTRLK